MLVPDWLIYFLGFVLIVVITGNLISHLNSRGLVRFLKKVARPVPRDYFDPFAPKADRAIQYEEKVVSGFVIASSEGLYLESVFSFRAVLPWEAVSAIRIKVIGKEEYANLRIRVDGEINRMLIVPWRHEFNMFVPHSVTLVKD